MIIEADYSRVSQVIFERKVVKLPLACILVGLSMRTDNPTSFPGDVMLLNTFWISFKLFVFFPILNNIIVTYPAKVQKNGKTGKNILTVK